MDFRDRQKYQEIYPLKLATDITAAVLGLYLLWQHALVFAIILLIVPPVIVSTIVIAWVPLARYKDSRFGRYIDSYMTGAMRLLRLGGLVGMLFGAWYHAEALIVIGPVVILLAWLRGILFPKQS